MLLNLLLLPKSSVLVFPPSSAEIPEMMHGCRWGVGQAVGSGTLQPASPNTPELGKAVPEQQVKEDPLFFWNIWSFWANVYFKKQGLESLKVTIRVNLPTFACLIKPFAIWSCTLISGHSPAGVSSLWLRDSFNIPLASKLDALQNSLVCRLH